MTLSPGSKLGPYEILSSIGSGGMGEVWKARDTRLGRIVAIKKVKEQHSERFKQEARSIAALNHPNICQIHDIGDDYLVLEYVEGKPLSSPLPEQEAVRLAIQVAAALEEAHQHGIIHRDLKPSNIMVTDRGSVKLLDFGLAKLYEQDQSTSNLPTEEFPATQAGAILGTVAYMSPEQAQGQPADSRSDIFSFGLVLYEMLSGRRAFSGDSTPEVMAALLRDEPTPLKASPALEKIVKRCLEKQLAERYQMMAELKAALEKAVRPKVSVSSEEPQPSIAVLPFVNMSGDKEQEYFSDGLAEEIINALTQIQGLKVIARTSAFAFKGKEQDIRKIAETLNVSNILEGSVRKAGNRIRITAQLITASDGSHLWSERYDRELTDVFEIQDEICQAIVEKLRVKLKTNQLQTKRQTEVVEAYNLFLKARHHTLRFTPESLDKGKEYCEQAIEADPNYALAWWGMADFYNIQGFFGFMNPRIASTHCRKAVLRALELDEKLPQAHATLGVLHAFDFEWGNVEREFKRALGINPEAVDVLYLYQFFYLIPMLRLDEAVDVSRKALSLDPLSPSLQYYLGLNFYYKRHWDKAIEQLHYALELDPHHWLSNGILGRIYMQIGDIEAAIRVLDKSKLLLRRNPIAMGFLGHIHAQVGQKVEAHRILEELKQLNEKAYVQPIVFSYIFTGLGELDKALDYLEKAVNDSHNIILHLPVDPVFDPLRSHPRYKALLRKMNLEP